MGSLISHSRRYRIDLLDYDHVLSQGYIEIEGWLSDKDRDKLNLVAEQHPELMRKLRVIREDDMKLLKSRFGHVIPSWESSFQ